MGISRFTPLEIQLKSIRAWIIGACLLYLNFIFEYLRTQLYIMDSYS